MPETVVPEPELQHVPGLWLVWSLVLLVMTWGHRGVQSSTCFLYMPTVSFQFWSGPQFGGHLFSFPLLLTVWSNSVFVHHCFGEKCQF